MKVELKDKLSLIRKYLPGIAGISALLTVLFYRFEAGAFPPAYLVNFLFWCGLTLGALPLIGLHHLVSGNWGFAIRRTLEAALALFPLIALFFIPILFQLKSIYPWADAVLVSHDEILKQKSLYLNPIAFGLRAVIYFVIWFVLSRLLIQKSRLLDQSPAKRLGKNTQLLSGIAILIYAFTTTFSSVDWAMSVEPHWYSTIYGVIFMIGNGLNAFLFALIFVFTFRKYAPFNLIVNEERSHELGNLLLAFVMLWAYMAVSQFIIIWSGNLQEEAPWYLKRFQGGWSALSVLLAVFHFLVPFLLLLMRKIKKTAVSLLGVAILVFAMRWMDLFWLIKPAFEAKLAFHAVDFSLWLLMGSIWLYAFIGVLNKTNLAIQSDPVLHHPSGSH